MAIEDTSVNVATQMNPRVLENASGQTYLNQSSKLTVDPTSQILDKDWAKDAFLVNRDDLDPIDIANRSFSSAYFKFTDSSIGGNKHINPKPQFTRYSDIRVPGVLSTRYPTTQVSNYEGKLGMGRYYSEALDDHAQVVYMRFGVPEFNSLTTFFTGFYDVGAARLAKTGRANDLFFSAGEAVGNVIGVIAMVTAWPLVLMVAAGKLYRIMFNQDTSKFYYFKPTMMSYWGAVNGIVNRIGVYKGLIPSLSKSGLPNTNDDQKINDVFKVDSQMLQTLSNLMPDVFTTDKVTVNNDGAINPGKASGGIDVYAVAGRSQRYAQQLEAEHFEQFNNESNTDFFGYVKKVAQTKLATPSGEHSYLNRLYNFLHSESGSVEDSSKESVESSSMRNSDGTKKKYPDKFFNYLESEFNDGSQFACFRVDYTGPVSESFSNAVGENALASQINSQASSARSTSFSFAGGNVNAVIGAAIDTVKGVVSGALDSLNLSGLMTLAGAAFADIPKNWESSTANLTRSTYTMHLTSPYGNTISQMTNIYIPLAMILAGTLPLSTGKQSWTSPFLCQLFDQGRSQTRLGMIDSLTITRGTGNLGFNKNNNAMDIEITFTVVDMSSIMHMPISKGMLSNGDSIFDDDTVFTDYMASLAGLGVKEQFYKVPKAMLKLANSQRNLQSLTSPAMWAMFVHEKTPLGMLDIFYKGSSGLSASVGK